MLFALLLACAHVPDATAGAQVYQDTCITCHGGDGAAGVQMDGVAAADLADVVPTLSDEDLAAAIQDGEGQMPAQGLDDDATADCIAWLRATFDP